MNIGIIGSGKMGSGLGKIWAAKGHHVIFSYSRHPERLADLARTVPNSEAATPAEAVRKGELVLLAVRWLTIEDALRQAGPMGGKTLIDCTNPLKPDMEDLLIGHTTSAAEEISRMAPGAKVVKAFNTAFAEIYHSESRLFGSRRPTMFYCGDDAGAKSTVARLINETGFSPIDAGPLSSSRYLEPLAMLMVRLGYGLNMGTNIALSLIRR